MDCRRDVASLNVSVIGECGVVSLYGGWYYDGGLADSTGPGTTTSGSTFPGSVGVGAAGAGGTGGNVAVLPMSVGMLSWPAGIAGGMPGGLG